MINYIQRKLYKRKTLISFYKKLWAVKVELEFQRRFFGEQQTATDRISEKLGEIKEDIERLDKSLTYQDRQAKKEKERSFEHWKSKENEQEKEMEKTVVKADKCEAEIDNIKGYIDVIKAEL